MKTTKIDSNRPDAYTKGWVEFYKLKFKVIEDVLIPRPETELLVDEIIKISQKNDLTNHGLTILDIGTGAGNISISIAKNTVNARITATDISEKALKVAKQNAKLHGVLDKITFTVSDLLENIEGDFDIIVTNLPYIPTERINYLDSSVKDYEPHVALDGGEDGFELYRKLFVEMIKKNLYPKFLIGEIDYTHGELATREALKYFPKCEPDVKFDLAHKQRFLVIKFFA